jgi:hypothetical protein
MSAVMPEVRNPLDEVTAVKVVDETPVLVSEKADYDRAAGSLRKPSEPDSGKGVWVSEPFVLPKEMKGDVGVQLVPDDLRTDARIQLDLDRWYEGAWHKIAGWGWVGPWETASDLWVVAHGMEIFAESELRWRIITDRSMQVGIKVGY